MPEAFLTTPCEEDVALYSVDFQEAEALCTGAEILPLRNLWQAPLRSAALAES